jgi:hypothetical protein
MSPRGVFAVALAWVLAASGSSARAYGPRPFLPGHHGHGHGHHGGRPPVCPPLGLIYAPLFFGGVGAPPVYLAPLPGPLPGSGLVNPGPPTVAGPGLGALAAAMAPPAVAAPAPARPRRRDVERANEVMTFGDRLFRVGNLVKATERYEQAVRADPKAAAPRVRLAQVALRRGKYSEAADRLREAQAAEPGWLINATDVQALFGEPATFAKVLAQLESHLQAHPNDRDAWLVLGAELYLSGRTQRAADVFLRLTDRAPDETLAAFLDATKAR